MDSFFRFIEKHPKAVIAIVLAITAFMLVQAMGIGLNGSYSAFIPWDENTDVFEGGVVGQTIVTGTERNAPKQKIPPAARSASEEPAASEAAADDASADGDLPYTGTYLLLAGCDALYEADNLNLLQSVLDSFSAYRDVGEPYSVLDYFTFERSGSRLRVAPISPDSDGAWTEEEAAILEDRITSDPIIRYFLVSGDSHRILFSIPVASVSSERLDEFYAHFDPLREAGFDVYINGGPVINSKVMDYLLKDLSRLLVLCFAAIIIIYYFTFRSKRSVLIPASLSLMGLIWTIGTMRMVGIDISILTVVTPCMVLTLGSAYTIYILSDYYASFSFGVNATAVQVTRRTMSTIFFACFTTVIGFLCLLASRTSGLKEFGVSVAFGLSYCAILSFTYLPAVLMLVRRPTAKQVDNYEHGLLSRFVHRLAGLITRRWYVLCLIFVLLCCGYFYVDDRIPLESNYMSYFPESDPFGQESRAFAEEMGGSNPFTVEIIAPEGSRSYFLEKENLEKVRAYEEAILQSPDILQSISFTNYMSFANQSVGGDYGIPENKGLITMLSRLVLMLGNYNPQVSQIVGDDFNRLSLNLQHWDSEERDLMTTASTRRVYQVLVDNLQLLPEGTTVLIKGDPIANFKFSNRLIADQNMSTMLSVLLVFLTTAILFRSPRRGLLTIIPVLSGIMINYIFMFIAGIPFDLVTVSFSSIAIGCGVDDAIHFMFRMRMEVGMKGIADKSSIHTALCSTGRSIIMTTVSIVVGMMMLSFASYTPIRYFGILMSVTLFGCMISTLLFLPSFALLFAWIEEKLHIRRRRA